LGPVNMCKGLIGGLESFENELWIACSPLSVGLVSFCQSFLGLLILACLQPDETANLGNQWQ